MDPQFQNILGTSTKRDPLKLYEKIEFNSTPVMLAAWQGMGNVGLIAMDWLRRTMRARSFAEIDMSEYMVPDSIVVKEGLARFPEKPTSTFHYCKNPDIIIFISNSQVSGKEGFLIISQILDLAAHYNVKQIFTSAAYALPISFQSDSTVLVASNRVRMLEQISKKGAIPMDEGFIAGLNGLLLGVAAMRKISAACLLGTIPSYATNLSYPKAAIGIIKILQHFLKTDFDLSELENASREMEQHLASVEEKITEFFPPMSESEDEEPLDVYEPEEEKPPQYIFDKIEQLFEVVGQNKSRASELREELVRWNLYDLYEKRFLDLFRSWDNNEKV